MKIAIVNDLMLGIEALRRAVQTVPGYEVIWIAHDGAEALANCAKQQPDIILMDLVMPVMDGVDATRQIMAKFPCAILVVTSTVSGNISKVFDAMGGGALDVVCTPVVDAAGKISGAEQLLNKIRVVSTLHKQPVLPPMSPARRTTTVTRMPPLVVIGASTGGPQALAEVLKGLPADFGPCVVIVQHVDQLFASGLASYLSQASGREVETISAGMKPTRGKVLLTSTNDHLIFTPELTFNYTREPAAYPYRPSVDVFFESAAQYWPRPQVAVLLTGMGRDGARGLLALRGNKWHTIAQDEKSSVVYGMPKAAAEMKAASEVLPLKMIAGRLAQLCKTNTGFFPRRGEA